MPGTYIQRDGSVGPDNEIAVKKGIILDVRLNTAVRQVGNDIIGDIFSVSRKPGRMNLIGTWQETVMVLVDNEILSVP